MFLRRVVVAMARVFPARRRPGSIVDARPEKLLSELVALAVDLLGRSGKPVHGLHVRHVLEVRIRPFAVLLHGAHSEVPGLVLGNLHPAVSETLQELLVNLAPDAEGVDKRAVKVENGGFEIHHRHPSAKNMLSCRKNIVKH